MSPKNVLLAKVAQLAKLPLEVWFIQFDFLTIQSESLS